MSCLIKKFQNGTNFRAIMIIHKSNHDHPANFRAINRRYKGREEGLFCGGVLEEAERGEQ